MDDLPITLYLSLGLIVVGFVTGVVQSYRRRELREEARRALERIPFRKIGELGESNEVVKVRGRVRLLGEVVVAPLAGWRCAAYETDVRWLEKDTEGFNQTVTREVIRRDCAFVSFLLEDETGTVLVEKNNLDVRFSPGCRTKYDKCPTALAEREVAPDNAWCEESSLSDGSQVIVVGVARTDTGATESSHGYRESARRFKLAPPPEDSLIVLQIGAAPAGGAR